MIRGRCPTCSKRYEIAGIDALPTFPFCSERCRLIDIGRWASGVNAIPGTPGVGSGSPDDGRSPGDEDGEE